MALEAFAGALALARERAGMTQKAVGDLLGVTQQLVGNWEQASREPSVQAACQLEVVLGVEPGALTKHLGFLPLTAAGKIIEHGVIDSILADPTLGDSDRKALLGVYRALTSAS
jgi:transcriptional regulator with XRE-family HTH domain